MLMQNIKQDLNKIFETNKFNNLRRLRNANGRGDMQHFSMLLEKITKDIIQKDLVLEN